MFLVVSSDFCCFFCPHSRALCLFHSFFFVQLWDWPININLFWCVFLPFSFIFLALKPVFCFLFFFCLINVLKFIGPGWFQKNQIAIMFMCACIYTHINSIIFRLYTRAYCSQGVHVRKHTLHIRSVCLCSLTSTRHSKWFSVKVFFI